MQTPKKDDDRQDLVMIGKMVLRIKLKTDFHAVGECVPRQLY